MWKLTALLRKRRSASGAQQIAGIKTGYPSLHAKGFGYRPVDDLSAVLMAGVRKPSGKEPAGGGVGGVLSMGICRGSVLGRGCTGRRNGQRIDDLGGDFVAAPAGDRVFLA